MKLKTVSQMHMPPADDEAQLEACSDDKLAEIEEQFRTVLGAIEGGVLAVDKQREVLFCSPRLEAQAAVPPESLLPGRTAMMAAGEVGYWVKHPEGFTRRVEEIYQTLGDVSHDIFQHIDGRIFELDSMPLLSNGRIAGRVWHFRDLTGALGTQVRGSHRTVSEAPGLTIGLSHRPEQPENISCVGLLGPDHGK